MVNGSNISYFFLGLDEYNSDEELNSVPLFKDYPGHLINFAVACYIIFIIIGIPGNLITILSLANYKKVRNATAIFIINLTISDLLTCCIVLPVKITIFLSRHWVGGKIMCMVYPIFYIGTYECSVFNIIAITLNRYVMVSHPQVYPKIYKNRNLAIMIFSIWLGAFAMLTPLITERWGRISLDPRLGFCNAIIGKDGNAPISMFLFINFIFPFILIVACYSRIIWIVKQSTKKMDKKPNTIALSNPIGPIEQEISKRETSSTETSNVEESEASESTNWGMKKFKRTFRRTIKKLERPSKPTSRDKKLQNMTVAILITFFLSHLPLIFVNFPSNTYCNIIGYVLLDMTTCVVNPLIYVVMSNEYRQAYKHLFKKVIKIRLEIF